MSRKERAAHIKTHIKDLQRIIDREYKELVQLLREDMQENITTLLTDKPIMYLVKG